MVSTRRHVERTSRRGAAFTLIEIILVVLIISLITALALPSLVNALRGQQLDSAASDIASACQGARYEALYSARTCWFVIDFDQQHVRLLQEPAGDTNAVSTYEAIAAETNIIDSATAEVKSDVTMPNGVHITGVQAQDGSEQTTGKVGFPFYNNGVNEPFRIFLQGDNDEKRALDIDMFTGKAKVFTPL
jgi:type II secretion system protein H